MLLLKGEPEAPLSWYTSGIFRFYLQCKVTINMWNFQIIPLFIVPFTSYLIRFNHQQPEGADR